MKNSVVPKSATVHTGQPVGRNYLLMNNIMLGDNFNNIFKKQLKVEESIVVSTFESPDFNKIRNLSNNIFYRTAGGGYWMNFLNTAFETTSLSNKSTTIKVQTIEWARNWIMGRSNY